MEQKISIIVPVYNTDDYLDRCIQSILNQTYTNLEIICINDGSTDNSGDILEKYAEQDRRIKVIHKQNEGVAAARNDGLQIATGEWIGFVDSDDYISENMYDVMLNANISQEADIVSCGYFFVEEENCYPAINQKVVPEECVGTRSFLRYIYERDVYKGVGGYLWSRLFKRDLIIDNDNNLRIEFEKQFDIGEDIIFLARVLLNSEKSLYVNDLLYHYVKRTNSLVNDEYKQLERLSWVKAYVEVLNLYKEAKIDVEVYNVIVRMFVYRCGKLMEVALRFGEKEKYYVLKEMTLQFKEIYMSENEEYPERLKWFNNILNQKE